MNKTINLANYDANVISDIINSIWFGECGDKKRSDYFCTINLDLQEILVYGLDTIKLLVAVNCGSDNKAEDVLKKLQELGFSTIQHSYNHTMSVSKFIYLLQVNF